MIKLTLILGPVFSGKTTELIRLVERYQIAKKNVLYIKPDVDTRYSITEICSHNNLQVGCEIYPNKVNELCIKDNIDVIGIDEAQFFTNIYNIVYKLLENNRIVIVSALNGDYKRKTFGNIVDLIPLAQDIIKLNAICSQCGEEASFSYRKNTNKTEQVVIGGSDVYEARCWECWK